MKIKFRWKKNLGEKIKSKTTYRPGLVIESQGRYKASKHKKLKREMLATITTNSCNLERRVSGLVDLKISIIIVGTYSFHYLHNYELFKNLIFETLKIIIIIVGTYSFHYLHNFDFILENCLQNTHLYTYKTLNKKCFKFLLTNQKHFYSCPSILSTCF